MSEDWRNPDGSVNYRDYMSSPEWRRFRESYWKRNPGKVCERCGMTATEHRVNYGIRLHLHHKNYRSLGCEVDEDLEPICKRCHESEHSGDAAVEFLMGVLETRDPVLQFVHWPEIPELPDTDWEFAALELIDIQRNQNAEFPSAKTLDWLEEFVRACMEHPTRGTVDTAQPRK